MSCVQTLSEIARTVVVFGLTGGKDTQSYLITQFSSGAYSAISGDVLSDLINLFGGQLTNEVLAVVCPPYTRVLRLSGCLSVSVKGILSVLNKCPNLRCVELCRCDHLMQTPFFTVLSRYMPNLVTLTLDECDQLTSLHIQKILVLLPNLQHLSLAQTNVTDESFILEGDIGHSCQLTHVNVSGCQALTLAAIVNLTRLCGPTLQHINLSFTAIDSAALWYLSGFTLQSALDILSWMIVKSADFTISSHPDHLYSDEPHQKGQVQEVRDLFSVDTIKALVNIFTKTGITEVEEKCSDETQTKQYHLINIERAETNKCAHNGVEIDFEGLGTSLNKQQCDTESLGTSLKKERNDSTGLTPSLKTQHCDNESLGTSLKAQKNDGGAFGTTLYEQQCETGTLGTIVTKEKNERTAQIYESRNDSYQETLCTNQVRQSSECTTNSLSYNIKCMDTASGSSFDDKSKEAQDSVIKDQTGAYKVEFPQKDVSFPPGDVKCSNSEANNPSVYSISAGRDFAEEISNNSLDILYSSPGHKSQVCDQLMLLNTRTQQDLAGYVKDSKELVSEGSRKGRFKSDMAVIVRSEVGCYKTDKAEIRRCGTEGTGVGTSNLGTKDLGTSDLMNIAVGTADFDIEVSGKSAIGVGTSEFGTKDLETSHLGTNELSTMLENKDQLIKAGCDIENTDYNEHVTSGENDDTDNMNYSNSGAFCNDTGVLQSGCGSEYVKCRSTFEKSADKSNHPNCDTEKTNCCSQVNTKHSCYASDIISSVTSQISNCPVSSTSDICQNFLKKLDQSTSTIDPLSQCIQSDTNSSGIEFQPQLITKAYNPALISVELCSPLISDLDVFNACVKSLFVMNSGIRRFEVSCRQLSDNVVGYIAEHAPKMRHLALMECEMLTSTGVHAVCSKCPLTYLNLQGVCFIQNWALFPLWSHDHITSLILAECNVTEVTLARIAQHAPQLTHLDLSWCEEIDVEEHCQTFLNFIQSGASLQTLLLRHLTLCESILFSLAENCVNLSYLTLSSVTYLNDSSLLAISLRCRKLEELDVSWNSDITDVGYRGVLLHLVCLRHLCMNGVKQITSKPLMPIIADLSNWRRCQALLQLKLQERHLREKGGIVDSYSSDEEFEDLYVPHRSTSFAPCLRHLSLEYSDQQTDTHLAEVAAVCRGTLTIIDYYGSNVEPCYISATRGHVFKSSQFVM